MQLSIKRGDIVYLDGQVEVTNNVGQNVLVGTYIKVNGNRAGYYSTENVIPAVHHLPLRTSAIYTADSDGSYKFSLVSYAGSSLAAGKTLRVEQGYGHLAAIVFSS